MSVPYLMDARYGFQLARYLVEEVSFHLHLYFMLAGVKTKLNTVIIPRWRECEYLFMVYQ